MLFLYKYSRIYLIKFYVILDVIFNGFWLGVLSKEQVQKIDEIYYETEKNYTNDGYNLSGLSPWENKALENSFLNCQKILLTSAGGGREVYGLEKKGFQVDAYECHPRLREFANDFLRRQGLISQVQNIERDKCPEGHSQYDGAIVGWGGYMLIQSRKARIEFLKTLNDRLKPGSPVLLSFYAMNGQKRKYIFASKIANLFRFLLLRNFTEVGEYFYPTYVHFFTKEKIQNELTESGFNLSFYSANPYGHAIGISQPQNQNQHFI